METAQVGELYFSDAGFVAERIEAIGGVAEQATAHQFGGALQELVALGANTGQLHLPLAFKGGGRKGWIQQNVGEEFETGGEIAGQDFGVDSEAVVAPVTVEAAADGFDLGGDFF